jgi:hypothetical protein
MGGSSLLQTFPRKESEGADMEDTVELSPTGFVEKEGRVIRNCIPNLKIMGSTCATTSQEIP